MGSSLLLRHEVLDEVSSTLFSIIPASEIFVFLTFELRGVEGVNDKTSKQMGVLDEYW